VQRKLIQIVHLRPELQFCNHDSRGIRSELFKPQLIVLQDLENVAEKVAQVSSLSHSAEMERWEKVVENLSDYLLSIESLHALLLVESNER
jgi:hypothetical protein